MSPIYVPGKVVFDNGQAPVAIAGVAPTLDYRFARDKREIETVSLTDKLTYTGSNGTFIGSDGLVQRAVTNVPRFAHSPTTRESLGLLVEEARTNLITYSEQFNNASWFGNANVTSNTDTAPDGNLTADTYSSSGNQIATNFIPISQNTNYTASLYIKKTTGRAYTAGFYLNYDAGTNYQILFNTNDGTFSPITGGTVPTTKADNAGSYWRVLLTANSGSTINVRFFLYPNITVNGATATGQQVLWGAQLEAGAFPTSYIPTVASAVTRAADVASIDGTGVITGTYTMVEKPAGCAVVSGSNINLQTGFTAQRVMVFPAALSAGQITSIRSAM
jgi:hypothetical protein